MQTEFVSRLRGVDQRLFADPRPTPDEGSFQVDNTSAQYYKIALLQAPQGGGAADSSAGRARSRGSIWPTSYPAASDRVDREGEEDRLPCRR